MDDILALLEAPRMLRTPLALLVDDVDIGDLRRQLQISQSGFCRRYGLPLHSLRNWEQGISRPDASARAYLAVIACDPERVAQLYAAAAALSLSRLAPEHLVDTMERAKPATPARRSPPPSRARARGRRASPAARAASRNPRR